jgi:hypothetical protein
MYEKNLAKFNEEFNSSQQTEQQNDDLNSINLYFIDLPTRRVYVQFPINFA